MPLDDKKAKVYELMANVIQKFLFSIAAIVAFFLVLSKYLNCSTTFDAFKYGAIEVLLGGTVFMAFKHYFPSKKRN
jgi:hypothetical protein